MVMVILESPGESMASSAAAEIIDGMVDGDGVEEGRAAIALFLLK